MAKDDISFKLLTVDELIDYSRNLTAIGSAEDLSDYPVVSKYISTIGSDAEELFTTHQAIKNDELNKQLQEADMVRDRALSVFRRLMQVHELAEDNSPEAIAFEDLDALWMSKYDSLPYLSLDIETEGIDKLLLDLATEKYATHIDTLQLGESVKKIKAKNDAFKVLNSREENNENVKPAYNVRLLQIELIQTLNRFFNYTNAIAESSGDMRIKQVQSNIIKLNNEYNEILSNRHSGQKSAENNLSE